MARLTLHGMKEGFSRLLPPSFFIRQQGLAAFKQKEERRENEHRAKRLQNIMLSFEILPIISPLQRSLPT